MKKIIPANTQITCDGCKRIVEPSTHKLECILRIIKNGLDFSGCAVGPGSEEYDLCDECACRITECIHHEIGLLNAEHDCPSRTPHQAHDGH